jgi:GT2 family glycosyltransferase
MTSAANPYGIRMVIFDNGSDPAHKPSDFAGNDTRVVRYKQNKGFYRPLLDLAAMFDDELVGLMHNDLFIYTPGWDQQIKTAFEMHPKLGVLGFVGSWQVDSAGGRGGGTMCNFRGDRGQTQAAGLLITNLRPSIVLDSLFMIFRRPVIDILGIDDDIVPAHFYDKIWCMRAIEHGWQVGTLGIEVDHMGGMTLVAEPAYEMDMRRWCEERGIAHDDNGGAAVYREAERRWLDEYRDQKQQIPAWIDGQWNIFR